MTIVYRYISIALVKPLIFCIFSFFFLWIIHDLFDTLGDLMKKDPEWSVVARYYLVQIPKVSQQVLPVSFFFSMLYVLANYSQSRELVALQAAGVSLARISVPFLIVAVIMAGIQALLYIDLAPNAKKSADALRSKIEGKPDQSDSYRTIIYDNPESNTTWFIAEIDLEAESFSQAEILITDSMGRDKAKYFAAAGNYRNGEWNLARVRKVEFLPGQPSPPATDVDTMDAPFLKESPQQLVAAMREPGELPWAQLQQFVTTRNPHTEIRMAPFRTEYFYRQAYPFISVVLCLYAFALGITNARQGRAASLFSCLVVLFGLLIWINFSVALGNGNRIPPWIASWSGIFFFGALGLYLYASKVGWIWNLLDLIKTRGPVRREPEVDLNEALSGKE